MRAGDLMETPTPGRGWPSTSFTVPLNIPVWDSCANPVNTKNNNAEKKIKDFFNNLNLLKFKMNSFSNESLLAISVPIMVFLHKSFNFSQIVNYRLILKSIGNEKN